MYNTINYEVTRCRWIVTRHFRCEKTKVLNSVIKYHKTGDKISALRQLSIASENPGEIWPHRPNARSKHEMNRLLSPQSVTLTLTHLHSFQFLPGRLHLGIFILGCIMHPSLHSMKLEYFKKFMYSNWTSGFLQTLTRGHQMTQVKIKFYLKLKNEKKLRVIKRRVAQWSSKYV